ncbi:UNVERIFIED_CONTAM: hypothetical protein RMT77_008305 [Armadillidium vulgare]
MNLKLIIIFSNIIFVEVAQIYFEKLNHQEFKINNTKYVSVIYYEITMDHSQNYQTLETETFCECKKFNIIMGGKTVSMARKSPTSLVSCNISMEMVNNIKLAALGKAITLALFDYSEFLGEDGMFYSVTKTAVNNEKGREECEKKINGRLLMTKTKAQFESVWAFRVSLGYVKDSNNFLLDLYYDDILKKAIWQDGTPYDESEIARYEIVPLNKTYPRYQLSTLSGKQIITVAPATIKRYFICQANAIANLS